jgi:hypothetical protein
MYARGERRKRGVEGVGGASMVWIEEGGASMMQLERREETRRDR